MTDDPRTPDDRPDLSAVERQLPMDPSTGDYVLIAGRPYTREELTAEWALARFPAETDLLKEL